MSPTQRECVKAILISLEARQAVCNKIIKDNLEELRNSNYYNASFESELLEAQIKALKDEMEKS